MLSGYLVGLTMGKSPSSHLIWAWGSSCLHGATSTVELQLANSCLQTHTHTSGQTSWRKVTFTQQWSVFLLMFTTFWSSGAQSSLRSLCSLLAHVVFLISNLILNLKPATTYRETGRTNMPPSPKIPPCPPPQVPLPVWWRSRQCAGRIGETSWTWCCTR